MADELRLEIVGREDVAVADLNGALPRRPQSPFFASPADTSTLIPLLAVSNFSLAAFTRGWSALDPLALTVELAGTTAIGCSMWREAPRSAGGSLLSHPVDAASAASASESEDRCHARCFEAMCLHQPNLPVM